MGDAIIAPVIELGGAGRGMAAIWRAYSSVPPLSRYALIPVPRKVWLHTSVVMPAALARRRTICQALV